MTQKDEKPRDGQDRSVGGEEGVLLGTPTHFVENYFLKSDLQMVFKKRYSHTGTCRTGCTLPLVAENPHPLLSSLLLCSAAPTCVGKVMVTSAGTVEGFPASQSDEVRHRISTR